MPSEPRRLSFGATWIPNGAWDFKLHAEYAPTGDQPQAIEELVRSLQEGHRHQTLLGVTGSGKTFTMANVVARLNRPTLVISHNKTLADSIVLGVQEFLPGECRRVTLLAITTTISRRPTCRRRTPTIEKDSSINEDIERMRIATTSSLVQPPRCARWSPASRASTGSVRPRISRAADRAPPRREHSAATAFSNAWSTIFTERNDYELKRGLFRVRGDVVDVMPAYSEQGLRVEFWGEDIEALSEFEPLTGASCGRWSYSIFIPPTNM